MPEEFEVHGAHDDALDRAAEAGAFDPLAGRIAVMTAILSTIGAVFGYQGGATQNEALLLKNRPPSTRPKRPTSGPTTVGQAEAIAELSAQLPGVDHERAAREAKRYAMEREQIRLKAESFEKAARDADEASEKTMHSHHRWAQALVATQVAIAMAAITILTRRRWLQLVSYGIGAVGPVLGVLAASLLVSWITNSLTKSALSPSMGRAMRRHECSQGASLAALRSRPRTSSRQA